MKNKLFTVCCFSLFILSAFSGENILREKRLNKSITRGLKWLVSQQDTRTGAFAGTLPQTYTALSAMALMSAGQFPGRARYGRHLRRAIRYLVRTGFENQGFFAGEGKNTNMYTHGICTLVLSEAYGMMPTPEENIQIKKVLIKAIKIIVDAQCKIPGENFGGWRYRRKTIDADLSVSVWQILALRSAKNCQLKVDDKILDAALGYVRSNYLESKKSFTYRGRFADKASPAMKGAGIVSMILLGGYEKKQDREKILLSALPLLKIDFQTIKEHLFYQYYYIASAANMLGGHYKEKIIPNLENHIMNFQEKSGKFLNQDKKGFSGEVYATAFSIIILSIHLEYLPIYQE